MTLPPNLFKLGAGSHPPHLAGQELVARGVVWAWDGGYEPGLPPLLAHVAECAA